MKTITYDDQYIQFVNDSRDESCYDENGNCYIITKIRVYQDEPYFEVEGRADCQVLATEEEALQWVAQQMRYSCHKFDSPVKYAYTIRFHHMEVE